MFTASSSTDGVYSKIVAGRAVRASRPTPWGDHARTWTRRLGALACWGALFVAPRSASAEEPAPATDAPSPLAPLEALLRAEGCATTEVLAVEERWYAACGTKGVLVARQLANEGFELVEQRAARGDARAVFVRSGLVWVETQHTEAQPLHELTPVFARPSELSSEQPREAVMAPPGGTPPTESTVAPSRAAGIGALEVALRPFLPIDELAIATIAELSFTYYGERPWYAQARFLPLGGIVGRGTDAGVLGMFGTAGYDHPLFSVGLGVGALRENTGDTYSSLGERISHDRELALAVAQEARLGAVDGLSLRVTNAFVLGDDRWQFGFVDVRLQVPTGRHTWITIGGGGGEHASFFYAELGLRRLVRGARGHRSLFVRPTIGVGGIAPADDTWVPGPMIGTHLEWRP